MSVNSLLYKNSVSESWKVLRLSSIVIDSELILSESARHIFSLDVVGFSTNVTSITLDRSNLTNDNVSNVDPIGITYINDEFQVGLSGYYLIDIKLQVKFNSGSPTPADIQLILQDSTSVYNLAQDTIFMATADNYNLSINRVSYLLNNVNYKIIIKKNDTQLVDIIGSFLAESYFSLIKII